MVSKTIRNAMRELRGAPPEPPTTGDPSLQPPAPTLTVGKVEFGPISPDLSPERARGLVPSTSLAPPETRILAPGLIVLFNIDDGQEVLRPLLISMVDSGKRVTGFVFFAPSDSLFSWPRTYLPTRIDKHNAIKLVEGVEMGHGVGQWRFR